MRNSSIDKQNSIGYIKVFADFECTEEQVEKRGLEETYKIYYINISDLSETEKNALGKELIEIAGEV